MTLHDELLMYQDWYEELRSAVADFERGVITLDELLDIAGLRR